MRPVPGRRPSRDGHAPRQTRPPRATRPPSDPARRAAYETIAAVHRDVQELREVQSAITRLQTNNFGVCMKCGVDIAYERLAAQPTARRCIECETRHERSYAHEASPKL